jgi:putative ABC transport system substrate-binding protein
MIDRRSLLALLPALAMPVAARAQGSGPPLVAWVGFASSAADQPALAALRKGLATLGHVDGKTIRIEARHTDGRGDALPTMVRELEAKGVAVFIAAGRAVARGLHRLTRTPIVSGRLPESDPELFRGLARPGGTVTGFSNFAEQIYTKQIELLKQVVPGLATIGVLYSTTLTRDFGAEAEKAAGEHGLKCIRLELRTDGGGDVERLIRSLRPAGAGALVVVQDFGTLSRLQEIGRLALAERMPTVADQADFAGAGALLSYGADINDQFRRMAGYVDRILKGAKPADLPIQLADKLYLIVNTRTAKALGLTLPPDLLLRADEVIE